ncbi:MAG TPA: sulfite exporter TauE/SafE family protein [Saccharospirillum sp.]|nr:sulfite exporter TauE/SafE family protein [Saccharospirillum sp.]
MITDPIFYLLAIPATLLYGISKGGMGGGLGIVAVPMMALVISPGQAAAIMLPILCVMDLFAVWGFRGVYDKPNLRIILPASMVGIGVGAATYQYLSDDHIKLFVGVISLVFALNWVAQQWRGRAPKAKPVSKVAGWFYGGLAGLTSFSVHAGGPPINMYLLPQQMNKTLFVGTTVVFFTVVNYVKLVPYAWMGMLDSSNLKTSLALVILAPIGIRMGMYMHHRINETWFYWVCYVLLIAAGGKLMYDSLKGLMG